MATGLVLEWQEQLPLLGWSVVWSWGHSVLGSESQRLPLSSQRPLSAEPDGGGSWLRETLELRTEITSLGFFKACWTRA